MTAATPRVPLYSRLPEIYRIRDAAQLPAGQLRAFLAAVEEAFGAVHESIESLYEDLFIETCDDWVVPYIADLVGTSHLSGDTRTLRADVADTIALRRRKGTGAALERLATNLTGWPCRCVELFERVACAQHLNHQRPDAGGHPPYGGDITRFTVARGGTPPLRDPAMLSLLGTPFDPFAVLPDTKPAEDGALHVDLPNVALFLWRLAAYRLALAAPLALGHADLGAQPASSKLARYGVKFDLDPLDRPVALFNTYRAPPLDSTATVHALTMPDAIPGPVQAARLTSGSEAGNPSAYVTVDLFDATAPAPAGIDVSETGLQLYLPGGAALGSIAWTFRGDNLCAWEAGLRRPLGRYEIVIDPAIGRILFGVAVAAERDALQRVTPTGFEPRIFAGYTYGAAGAVGAHPISRAPAPASFAGVPVADVRRVEAGGLTLQAALDDVQDVAGPLVVEIADSLVHPLDLSQLTGVGTSEGQLAAIQLAHSLVIRAASGQRPTIALVKPLAFRPVDPAAPSVAELTVRFEGVFLTRAASAGAFAIVARAAVARLELDGCTLDPGGHRLRKGPRAPLVTAIDLRNGFGFAAGSAELGAFKPAPQVILQRTITGALHIDDGYRLTLEASIVDGGRGVAEPPDAFAICSASDPATGWGPALAVRGAHVLGRARVSQAIGSGAIFVHALEVLDHQHGCLKHCYFSGAGDRLPPNHACVAAPGAKLHLASTVFGDAAYCQISRSADHRIRDRGPGDDAMGAYGFELEAHKWANLAVRLREFMPAGARPLPIAVT